MFGDDSVNAAARNLQKTFYWLRLDSTDCGLQAGDASASN
jgi:hypothetical protein